MQRSDDPASRPTPVSLRALAEHLKVSKATVSRALNGYADISEATRRRVKAAAEALRYEPSTQARRLARGTSESIGLVLATGPAQITTPFIAQLLAALSDALAGHGYDLIVRFSSEKDELEDYRQLWAARKVDGFALTRTRPHDARVDFLLEAGAPFVTHGRTHRWAEHAWVEIDGEHAFRTATEHLIALGHRRVAHISSGTLLWTSHERRRGYEAALAAAGLPADPALFAEGDLTSEGGLAATRRLLALAERPTAILCGNDMTALGAIAAAREAGLAVPDDLSVIGYDGIPVGAFIEPPLTTMTQDGGRAGRRLAAMLMALIGGGDPRAHQELWQAELLRRASDAPPRGAAGNHADKGSSGRKKP